MSLMKSSFGPVGVLVGLLGLSLAFNWLLSPPMPDPPMHEDPAVSLPVSAIQPTPINIWRPPLMPSCVSDPEWTITATTDGPGQPEVESLDYEITASEYQGCIGKFAASFRVTYVPKDRWVGTDELRVIAGNRQKTMVTYALEVE